MDISWFKNFTGKSNSTFVSEEVLKNLPKSIIVQFSSEFDKDDNPVIFICAPEYEGLISEAHTREEAIENAQDAIVTYFDVPKACADLVQFDVSTVEQSSLDIEGSDSIRIKEFRVKDLTNA